LSTETTAQPIEDLIGKSDQQLKKYEQLLQRMGIEYYEENTEYLGTCPFCEGKFSMNKQTALWQCFRCGKSGNTYALIRLIHPFWLERTSPSQKAELVQLRKGAIDLEEIEDFELAYNGATHQWMIPARTEDGSLNNLYSWVEQYDHKTNESYRQLMSAPGFNQMPYGLNRFRHSEHPVWILEGHWDYLAFWGLLRRTNQLHKFSCLGTPGTSFPQKWLDLLRGRAIITCFDNDEAGKKFTDNFASLLSRNMVNPKSLHHLHWPEGFKKGFDVSDVITSLPVGHWKKKG
jgi:hypothetical protein